MANYIVLGAQWGDEGKGKIVDMLAGRMDMVIRFQGGANAGHTVIVGDEKYVLHLVPGGVVSGKSKNVIGNGCVVDPVIFSQELSYLEEKEIEVTPQNLIISQQAHMVTPLHKFVDKLINKKIGTTGRGIGPAYEDKAKRTGIRMESILDGSYKDKYRDQMNYYKDVCERVYNESFIDMDASIAELEEGAQRIKAYIQDSIPIIYDYVKSGKNILLEGAQGSMLDIDHGTYPFVTSSSTTIGGAYTGIGVYMEIDKRIAIVKSYTTRVGEGPFPTEQENEIGDILRKNGNEFGATTGRPRRCGWLDLQQLKRSFIVNGYNYISLSKISCLSGIETIKAAVSYDSAGNPQYKDFPGWQEDVEGITDYEQLPLNCRNYISFIEDYLETPVGMISTGPDRSNIIVQEEL